MNKIMESKSLLKSRHNLAQDFRQKAEQNSTQKIGENVTQDFAQNRAKSLPLDFATPLLEVKDLCFWRFVGLQKMHILKNISFSLQKGEILSVLGRNGAGKTTLLKCLLGFLKSSGDISLQGRHITELRGTMWDKVSYVAQIKGAPLPISALEMVVLGLNNVIKFQPKKEHFARAREVLNELGIAHLADKNCASLSGGELQMVLFARALAKRPKILILDEPESNLDFANQKMILDTLKSLSKQGVSIVLNTHFPAHALFLSHKVLLLSKLRNEGEIDSNAIFGTSAYFGNENHRSASNGIFGGRELLQEVHLSELYSVPLELHSKVSPFSHDEFIVRI